MNHLVRRVRQITVAVSLVTLTGATLFGAVEDAYATTTSTRCKSDSIALRAFARQQVNNAAARTVPYSSISSFPTIAASAKDRIAQTSGNTGGRARDIFLIAHLHNRIRSYLCLILYFTAPSRPVAGIIVNLIPDWLDSWTVAEAY